ncbi:MAG TPA: DNA ligase (NAD(+)) LigA, partial [Ruminococcaceae bacterium]|nr:DNA ligase (NAD(+)) LigA [Oscillospiraceae bacterium]
EAATRCPNPECPAQLLRHIIHFTSRDAMDIDGFGPAVIEQLVQAGLMKSPADIYTLPMERVKSMERMGEKSAQNLAGAIERSKENDLYRLVFAL